MAYRPCTDRQRELIIQSYERHRCLTKAKRAGRVNQTRAYNALREAGYMARKPHGRTSEMQEAKRLYIQGGLSLRQAAARVDICPNHLGHFLSGGHIRSSCCEPHSRFDGLPVCR